MSWCGALTPRLVYLFRLCVLPVKPFLACRGLFPFRPQHFICSSQQFFYPMMSQLIVAPCILIAALILLWFQIRYVAFFYACA